MENKFSEQLKKIRNLPIVFASSANSRVRALVRSVVYSGPFLVAVFIVGLIGGFLIGARAFETGHAGLITNTLKGASVRVSGPCKIDGEVRKPALAEDEVKIVSINAKSMIGVIRATRETVECDLSVTAIDSLPLLSDFKRSPISIPDIKPAEIVRADAELAELKNRSIKVSGTCQESSGLALPALLDEAIEVIGASRSEDDKSNLRIVGLIKKSKTSVVCMSHEIRYSILDSSGSVVVPGASVVATPQKRDLVNEVILVTSTCFPDKRLPATRDSKNLFFSLINAKVQVTQNTFDEEGKLSYIAGALIDKGAMIECDSTKYPLTWKLQDSNNMRLEPIKGASDDSNNPPPAAQSQRAETK